MRPALALGQRQGPDGQRSDPIFSHSHPLAPFCVPCRTDPANTNVWVGNIDPAWSDPEINEHFSGGCHYSGARGMRKRATRRVLAWQAARKPPVHTTPPHRPRAAAFGPIAELRLHKRAGYGFVRYHSHADAVAAIAGTNKQVVHGKVRRGVWRRGVRSALWSRHAKRCSPRAPTRMPTGHSWGARSGLTPMSAAIVMLPSPAMPFRTSGRQVLLGQE